MKDREKSIKEILDELVQRRWTYSAIARELGVASSTVWRWHNAERRKPNRNRLVHRALLELLEKP